MSERPYRVKVICKRGHVKTIPGKACEQCKKDFYNRRKEDPVAHAAYYLDKRHKEKLRNDKEFVLSPKEKKHFKRVAEKLNEIAIKQAKQSRHGKT